ncbi:DNA alkylation repair protein [Erysipelothrix aquatica]|uniref:DNA alkylation repair protein n=1 Tax=Erysipelothrix aquatica TaxID=2683714 RepID=UPI001358DC56|nr:DNA alkylation repair protein [Erysipelothrix aquatica]
MTYEETMEFLKTHASSSRRKSMIKQGAPETTLGVTLGPIRKLAKTIGMDHELSLQLWESDIVDAQLLAVMLMDPSQISVALALSMIDQATYEPLQDDLLFRTLVAIPDSEALKKELKEDARDAFGRAYWSMVVHEIGHDKTLKADRIAVILDTIEAGLVVASPQTQWMMNRALSEIGFRFADYTQRCITIGESLGVYRDMKVAPGCTSAYAPAWIEAVLSRKRK